MPAPIRHWPLLRARPPSVATVLLLLLLPPPCSPSDVCRTCVWALYQHVAWPGCRVWRIGTWYMRVAAVVCLIACHCCRSAVLTVPCTRLTTPCPPPLDARPLMHHRLATP